MNSLASKLLLIGGMAAAAAGAAVAAPADNEVYSVVLRFPTASLATDNGVKSLYRRIEMAAEKVCVIEDGSRVPSEAVLMCRKEAIASAVNKIHNQRLAALHAASNKSG